MWHDTVHQQSCQCRYRQQEELQEKGYDNDTPQQTRMADEILHIRPHRLTLISGGLETGAGLEYERDTRKRLAEGLHGYKSPA